MTDIATLGLALDSRPIVDGTKALDAFAEAGARVDQRVRVSNSSMADTSKIMRAQEEAAKATAAANTALGGSTNQLTLGQQQLIEKYREQAATIGMSRSQLMAYQAAQMGVTAETEKSIAAVKAHEDALKAAAKAKDDATRASNQLSDALKLLAAGYALLKITEYAKEAALMAARYETLGVVLEVVGRNAGYTKTQMDAAADGIARQGITMLESRNSAVKLVQAHVDLANASGLARIAQDAAVIGNINSSEAFDRLVNGISRGNVLILRNIGINVNLQTAYTQMADSLGKTTKELSENERVQARLNAVVERGTDIAGTYEAAMGTAGKQLLSMQRYIDDLKVNAGEAFNETLTVGVMAFTDHLKDANGEVSELAKNGQLAQWGHDLAAVMVGVANAIDNVLTGAKMAGTWAGHFSASGNIDTQYSRKLSEAPKDQQAVIRREWAMALANEQAQYDAAQTDLGGRADRFQRAFDERTATQLAKQKATAEAKLKVDQDYAARSQTLLIENAGKSLQIQQAAQAALAKSVYGGTPTYRDTEGREPKDKIDQAENTRLADHIKRIEAEVAAEKAGSEYMMRIDEMRHQAGELGDAQFYERRRGYADEIAGAEIAGYNKELAALRAHHNNTEAEAAKNAAAIHDTLDKLAGAKSKYAYDDLIRDEEDRQRASKGSRDYVAEAEREIAAINAQVASVQMKIDTFGKSKDAVDAETIAIAQNRLEMEKLFGADSAVIAASEGRIAALKRLHDVDASYASVEAANKAATDAAHAWKHTANTIESDLTNAILDGGGRGWKKLVHDMEFAFARMILQPILQPISGGIASMVNPMAPQSQVGGSAVGSAVGMAGSLFGAGGMAGSLAAGAGWVTGASTLGASLVGTGTVAGGMAGAGMIVGALAPIALGIGAAVTIWKKLDTSGTYHTGGASSASSSGVSTIRAESLGFAETRTNADTEKMTAGLVTGIVGILDSTALAFGKTAGYTAATAFADDTSKDGAWGALLIGKLGETIVNWDSTRRSRWAPKEFGDGAEGQAQYLAALSASVRTALDDIGLPAWAKTMLDNVGDGASIEDIAKVVDGINATQRALVIMGDKLAGFANLSDGAVSALIAAAGGIDALASSASSYYDNFYSDAEKTASSTKQVGDALAAVGLAMPATREAYRAQVEAQMALGEAGAPAVAALFGAAAAFVQLHPAIDSIATAAATAAQAIVDARSDLSAAYDSESGALKSVIQAKLAEADATKKQMNALKIGALSTLSPEQKLAETQRQFNAASGADKTALAGTYLEALKGYYGSTQAYAEGYAKVQAALAMSAASSTAEATIAQRQLTAMDKQAELLLGIKGDTATFSQALAHLSGLIQAGGSQTNASERQIKDLYATLLGRPADTGGLAFWSSYAASGASLNDLIAGIKNSPEYIQLHGAHANGGVAMDWSLVGEKGPELVNFSQPGRVYTASQTQGMFGGSAPDPEVAKLLREVLVELRADKSQRGEVGAQTLEKLDKVADELSGVKRKLAAA